MTRTNAPTIPQIKAEIESLEAQTSALQEHATQLRQQLAHVVIARPRGNPNWYKGMPSPNRTGRNRTPTAEIPSLASQEDALLEQSKLARGTRERIDIQTDPLYAEVHRIFSQRPTSWRELMEQLPTDTNVNRVKAIVTKMQREETGIVNLGEERRAIWFIPDQEVLKRLRRATETIVAQTLSTRPRRNTSS